MAKLKFSILYQTFIGFKTLIESEIITVSSLIDKIFIQLEKSEDLYHNSNFQFVEASDDADEVHP